MRSVEQPGSYPADSFSLDGDAAVAAIGSVWHLGLAEPDAWRLDRFGPTIGLGLENLAGVVFAAGRGLVRGPKVDIRVYAVADPHRTPMLVCLATPEGPMLCSGIEDFEELIPASAGPEQVVFALRHLLAVATETYQRRTFDTTSEGWDEPSSVPVSALGAASAF